MKLHYYTNFKDLAHYLWKRKTKDFSWMQKAFIRSLVFIYLTSLLLFIGSMTKKLFF